MWIRLESFPAESPPDTPTAVWNCFCGNVEASSDGDKGILFTLGRKEGGITFPKDKSVSRQHGKIRCIYAGDDEHLERVSPPRNDAERQACENNPFNMCLVMENTGKAGTFIAEIARAAYATEDTSTTHMDDDDETDDEGVISQQSAMRGGRKPHASSVLGEGKVVTDVSLTRASQHFYGHEQKGGTNPQLVKIDVGQSRVLGFPLPIRDEYLGRSVMVQVGLNGSTLKITWVSFVVAFSSVPSATQKEWREKMHRIGAEEAPLSKQSTHLVVPALRGTAKPLVAWCWGIPIVTPDYLQALMEYPSRSTETVPSPEDFKPPPKDKGVKQLAVKMQTTLANPTLMAPYMVLTCEPGENNLLVEAAGATMVPLHQERNTEAMIKKAKEALGEAHTSNQVCLILWSKKRVYTKVAAWDGIIGIKPTEWAKAVSEQDRKLKDIDGNPIELPPETQTEAVPADNEDDSDTEDEGTTSQRLEASKMETQQVDSAQPHLPDDSTDKRKSSESQIIPVESSETQVPIRKRRRRGQIPEEKPAESHSDDEPKEQRVSPRRSARRSRAQEKIEETAQEDDESVPMDEGGPTEDERNVSKDSKSVDPVEASMETEPKNYEEFLGKPDASGWFAVASKDNAKRKAWRKKASKLHAEEYDGVHFMPPAKSESVAILQPQQLSSSHNNNITSSTFRPPRANGPDFKCFRKNIVPRKMVSGECIQVEAVQARESEEQQRLEETQRELEAEQRRADELFRDIGAKGTRRRRR